VFQCLKSGKREEISRIILTASGGAFRSLTRAELKDVGVEDALRHPNWRMGAKITVDSATMANKGLEIIEAHHLFGVEYDRIETLLHPESAVHSLVEFRDRSVIAQLSLPDMRIPIQYALFYPERVENEYPELRLEDLNKLHFYKMDYNRYPLLDLAYEAGKAGGIMPAVYNAANEAAVELFLNGRIAFLDIETIVEKAVADERNVENPTLDTVLRVDREVKSKILNQRWVK
jgi:1-deoxy-D-xylulose-5-phosphate reductoisomerase